MIPVKLEFRGLNSYRAQQTIDFSQLMAQGLFGIFGPTGAGKSTVLDAMTLALFGQVRRAPRQTQGIINSREERCWVRFTFSLSHRLYTAERLFERVKKEPFACTCKSCRLVEDDARVLADKSKLMDEEVVRLLNMDCERFCQTVILPQGEFDQLLRMKPSARSGLLEELFHYHEYGEALVGRCRQRLKLTEAQALSLQERLDQLGACADEDLAELRKELTQAEEQERELAQAVKQAEDRAHSLAAQARQALEKEKCEAELAKLLQEAEGIAAVRHEAELARAAEPLRLSLEEAVRLNVRLREATQRFEAAALERQEALSAAAEAARGAESSRQEWQQAKDHIEPSLRQLELAAHEKQAAEQAAEQLRQARQELADSGLMAKLETSEAALADIRARQERGESELARLRQGEQEAFGLWEQAREREDQARSANAAALLAQELHEGQPCPVCGSIHHQPMEHHTADLDAASGHTRRAKDQWTGLGQKREAREKALRDLADKEKRLAAEHQSQKEELSNFQARLSALEQARAEQDGKWRSLSSCQDPASEHQRLQGRLQELERRCEQAAKVREAAAGRLDQAKMTLENAAAQKDSCEVRLSELGRQLAQAAQDAGFASANAARAALREGEYLRQMTERVQEYDQRLIRQQQEHSLLLIALRDFDPDAVEPARERAASLSLEQQELHKRWGRLQQSLEQAEGNAAQAARLSAQKQETQKKADVLRRLYELLRGNAFVRYLARGSLLELAHEASATLLYLTSGRYRLELTEDGGDFILVDTAGDFRRLTSSLSGGETFQVSLALALALSGKIRMQNSSLGFFFLDEGFGSLGGDSLDAAMAVLEKLPSDKRAVGLITHVGEVRERVPRYLAVSSDPVQGSRIELKLN